MQHGWHGERIRLVPLDRDKHLQNAFDWINNPVVSEWLCHGDFPVSRLAEEEWFANASKQTDTDVFFAIELLAGEHIGFTGIHKIDWRHGVASSGSLIGRTDLWGQGYGTESVAIRARYLFEVLGLRMATSSYMSGNDASRKMQERNGYREVGRWPARFWKRGAYRDEILMALTREDWQRLQSS